MSTKKSNTDANEGYIALYKDGIKDLKDYTSDQKETFVKALSDHNDLQKLAEAYFVVFEGDNKDKIAKLYLAAKNYGKTVIFIISVIMTLHSTILFYFLRNFTVFYYFIMYFILTFIILYLCVRLILYFYAKIVNVLNEKAKKFT